MGIAQKIIDWLGNSVESAQYEAVGESLAPQTYYKQLAIHIAVSYIANTISKCEIKTYKAGEEVRGELYYRLNVNPNPNENSSQFMNHLIERYFYHGSALVVPYNNWIYVSDSEGHERYALTEDIFSNVTIYDTVLPSDLKMSEVFYFKLDNRKVASLINGMFEEYGAVLASAIEHFKETNSEKYKLVLESTQAGDTKFQQDFESFIKQQLKTFIESDRAVYPQFQGQSLERFDVGQAASSSDIIALRKEVFETTAQAFKIPISMMLGNITNMNEIVKVYLSICIDPLAQMLSEELTRKTTTYEDWAAGDRVVVDTSKINHVDILEVADGVDKLIASGAFTIDQILDRCGYNPLNTDFSQAHFLTKNYADITETTNQLGGGGETDE